MIALARWIVTHGDVVLFVAALVSGWIISGFLTVLFLHFTKFWHQDGD